MSPDGGLVPFWSPDGNELHYFNDTAVPWMTARLQQNPVPAVLSVEELFALDGGGSRPFQGAGLHPDGDRFILALSTSGASVEGGQPDRLVLIQNFFEELKRLVPN